MIVLFYVLKSVVTLFAGANLDDVLHIVDEYLAVADVAGVQHLFRRLDHISDRNLADHYVNLHLWQQSGFDLNTSVILGLALLHAAA